MITDEQLAELERVYGLPEDQKCPVCGAPLAFSASGSRGARYNCSSDDASPVRSARPLRERQDHYAASAWYDRGRANPLVTELARAYRELSTTRSETVRKALELAERLAGVLASSEALDCVYALRLEQADTRPYQPQLRWAPYQEFASDPGLEELEPPAGPFRVRATAYRDNYVIIYWREG